MVLLKKDVCRLTNVGLQCAILIFGLQCAILIFALVFSVTTVASGINAPFSGSRINGLTRNSTVFEYDSTVDNSGNLVDVSGSNLLQYSQDFDNAVWTASKVGCSITANSTTYRAPDGTVTADMLVEDGSNGGHYITSSNGGTFTLTAGVTYTYSLYGRPVGRDWAIIHLRDVVGATNHGFYVNFSQCIVGNDVSGSVIYDRLAQKTANNWCRVSFKYKAVTTNAHYALIYAASANGTFSYAGTNGLQALAMWGAQVAQNDSYRVGPGIYHPTTATTKPAHDMAPTNSPTSFLTTLQDNSGRLLRARTFNGSNQYYSAAHHDSFNIFDSDFTVSTILSNNVAASGTDGFFRHGGGVTGGITIYVNSGYVAADFFPTTVVTVTGPAVSVRDSYYHVVQVVRKNNIGYMYIDGIIGTPVSVLGKGTDGVDSLYVGTAGGTYFDGSILYTRVDAEALSDIQLAKEREILQGTLMSSGKLSPGSTFSRSSLASVKNSRGTIDYFASETPRISGDGGGVRIEEARTNLALQSQTLDNASWTQVALTSITANGAQSPDTTVTAEGFVGTAVDTLHGITQGVTLTAAYYDISVFAKPGNKNWIYLSDDTVANATMYCNILMCIVGTVGAGGALGRAEPYADSWCRCSFRVLGTAASHTIKIASANADTDNDFAGDATTVNTWFWGAQAELGYHPTSYIATTSSSVTRSADSLTIEPWRISKNTVVSNPTFAMYFDNDVCNTTPCYTYASEVGNYSFTVYGDTKHVESQTLNDYFSFDGTGDYLRLPNTNPSVSDFHTTNNISIVAIFSPGSLVGADQTIFGNLRSSCGYSLSIATTSVKCTSGDGASTTNTKTSAFNSTGPILVTCNLTVGTVGGTNSVSEVYVNDLSVQTKNDMRRPSTAVANQSVGIAAAENAAAEYFTGKIHYLAFYKGTVITQAQHNTMYANFKEANILPTKVGNSYENKKLYIDFDAKCMYPSGAAMGPATSRVILSVSGNKGTASNTKNHLRVLLTDSGNAQLNIYDNGSTSKYLYGSTYNNYYDQWHRYKGYFNFANMAQSTFSIDGVALTTNDGTMTSTSDFDLTDTQIRIGQAYEGTTTANCSIKNLKMYSAQ